MLTRQLLLETDEASSGLGREVAYSFSHQKLGEVVYSEAGAARRRLLHRRAFETLQATLLLTTRISDRERHFG